MRISFLNYYCKNPATMLPASLRKQKRWPRRLKSSVLRISAHFSPIPQQAFPQMVCFLLWWTKKKYRKSTKDSRRSPYTCGTLHKEHSQDRSKNVQLQVSPKRYQSVRMIQGVDCILLMRTAYSANKQHCTFTWSSSTFKRVQFIINRFMMSFYLIRDEFTSHNSSNHVGMA